MWVRNASREIAEIFQIHKSKTALPHLNIYVGASKGINSQISTCAEKVMQRFCTETPPACDPLGIALLQAGRELGVLSWH